MVTLRMISRFLRLFERHPLSSGLISIVKTLMLKKPVVISVEKAPAAVWGRRKPKINEREARENYKSDPGA